MKKTLLLHRIHRWTGLLSGINILILSLTGAYLVFSEEIHHYFEAPRGAVLAKVDMDGETPLQDAFDALLPQYPNMVASTIAVPEHEEGVLTLFLREGMEEFKEFELDLATGEVFEHVESTADQVNHFILHLHADLFLGTMGILFLGFIGLLFLISTVTGIIIYAPFMKQSFYGALRWDKGVRRNSADFHKLIGATSLGFNLLMALTGIALTVGFAAARIWLFNEAATMIAADTTHQSADTAIPPVDIAWASANALHPDVPVSSLTFPGSIQGTHHFLAFHSNPDSLTRFIPMVSLVPRTEPAAPQPVPVPMWITVTLICVPFHFGNFGGILMKIVYVFFGLSAGLLSMTGTYLWLSALAKRRRMRRHARRELGEMIVAPEEGGAR